MMQIKVEFKGIESAVANINTIGTSISGEQMVGIVQQGTLMFQAEANTHLVGWQSPATGGRDTGALASSLNSKTQKEGADIIGRMGSPLYYAPFVEYNTGAHLAPAAKVAPWADSHGVSVGVVLQAIARRGTTGKKYIQKTLENKSSEAVSMVQNFVNTLVAQYG